MIKAMVRARFVNAEDVDRPFHDADQAWISLRIGTDGAGVLHGQCAAIRTLADLGARIDEEAGQVANGRGIRLDDMQRNAFGGARSDPWKSAEPGNERFDRLGEGSHKNNGAKIRQAR